MEKLTSDFHVHCGQYYDTYYQPAFIIKALANNGVKNVWLSSTTSCIKWNSKEEKKNILQHIKDEMEEAIATSKKYNINLTPLYWVLPQRYFDGETIESIMANSVYKGFKIHPQVGGWEINQKTDKLFESVCVYASKNSLPILIHTGNDNDVSPDRFENFFSRYKDVKFVLAHCKEYNKIIELMLKYNNIFGDTAFCSLESYYNICSVGLKNRMQIGTDFPITHWFLQNKNNVNPNFKELNNNYKLTRSNIVRMIKYGKLLD